MSKEMIISSSAHETRVAILEDDQVAEIFIERERSRGVVGNVYKGRVSKVLPGMQSAFVDLGLERDGFLYVTDVVAAFEELDRFETEEDEQLSSAGGNGVNGAPAGGGAGGPRRIAHPAPAAVETCRTQGRTGLSRAVTGIGKRVPSRRSKTSSKKVRRSSSRWPRSRLAPRVPA